MSPHILCTMTHFATSGKKSNEDKVIKVSCMLSLERKQSFIFKETCFQKRLKMKHTRSHHNEMNRSNECVYESIHGGYNLIG